MNIALIWAGTLLVLMAGVGILRWTRVRRAASSTPPRQPRALGAPLDGSVASGRLVGASSGYPLAGMRISARLNGSDPEGIAPPVQLGETVSGADGAFAFRLVDAAAALLVDHPDALVDLRVTTDDGQGEAVLSDALVPAFALGTTLSVPLPRVDISAQLWTEVGEAAAEEQLTRVNELAHALVAPAATGFSRWDAPTRHSLLLALDEAFLDPRGRLRSNGVVPTFRALRESRGGLDQAQGVIRTPDVAGDFAEAEAKLDAFRDLESIDWVLETRGFAEADAARALGSFSSRYKDRAASDLIASTAPPSSPLPETDKANLISYRNYLRATWVAIPMARSSLTDKAAVEELDRRFHQHFRTKDTDQRPANELAITILSEALRAPVGAGHGLGMGTTAIDSRGTRTARQYLVYLVSLTKLSRRELSLRYRIDLDRPDNSLSSPVQQNIATLQAFLHDGFQSDPDPFPIIPESYWDDYRDRPPFFLGYEEWLHHRLPFYGENFHRIAASYIGLSSDACEARQKSLTTWAEKTPVSDSYKKQVSWVVGAYALGHYVAAGNRAYQRRAYAEAYGFYVKAAHQVDVQANNVAFKLKPGASSISVSRPWISDLNAFDFGVQLDDLRERRKLPVENAAQLRAVDDYFVINPLSASDVLTDEYDRLRSALVYFVGCVLPLLLGDVAFAQGDYERACYTYSAVLGGRFGLLGMADEDARPYREDWPVSLHTFGKLPYTFRRSGPFRYTEHLSAETIGDWGPGSRWPVLTLPADVLHRVDIKCFRLRLGEAMLAWADSLYRRDDPSSLARARELYKGVLLLHGRDPGISPSWDEGASLVVAFVHHDENPALSSQVTRARVAMAQLRAGLNYFGYNDDVIPVLRYRPLKDEADRLAGLAAAVQAEFMTAMEEVEDMARGQLTTAALRQKAELQRQIATEQVHIAESSVAQALEQKAAVEQAIEAKVKEIEDHDSFWVQLKDAASGFSDAIGGLGAFDGAKGGVKADLAGEGGAAAGASIMAGFAIFAYGGYMSIGGMADAANKRKADLATLREKVLPAAQKTIETAQRGVAIGNLQREIAGADAELARALVAFDAGRFLNAQFWVSFANVMQRLLRRYIDLAARTGWLAERALAYEQDRALSLVGFDYFPVAQQGVTGADLLTADLAELEASRLEWVRDRVPIKHTFSVARDFMLSFGQLKRTGTCVVRTSEEALRAAYPGTYGHRLRAVGVGVVKTASSNPVRGLLLNNGVSMVSGPDGSTHLVVRPSAAFPISEFRLREDMELHGLPGDNLLTFEGSGADTFWVLELLDSANGYGLESVGDILLTLDLDAGFSPVLHDADVAAAPRVRREMAMVSASRLDPKGLDGLRSGGATRSVVFDVPAARLTKGVVNRKVANLVVFVVGSSSPAKLKASLSASSGTVRFDFENGIAVSNAPPVSGPDFSPAPAPSALNLFAGAAVDQAFKLTIDPADNPGLDLSHLSDVVLGLEYVADLR